MYTQGNWKLGKLRHKWEDNIKMELREICCVAKNSSSLLSLNITFQEKMQQLQMSMQ
jgi:hypothetical protein